MQLSADDLIFGKHKTNFQIDLQGNAVTVTNHKKINGYNLSI